MEFYKKSRKKKNPNNIEKIKKKKWRLYNDCYTESDKKIAGPRFELGLSGL